MHINKSATRKALFGRQKTVRILCRFGEEFGGFEVGAMRDDTKPGMKHVSEIADAKRAIGE